MKATDRQIILEQYRRAWHQLDTDALLQLWDTSEEHPVYIPEETAGALTSWDAIRNYWKTTERLLERIELETLDPSSGPLGESRAWLLFTLRWKAVVSADAAVGRAPIGGELRVFAALRDVNPSPTEGSCPTDPNWKFTHYIESPLGALPFLRKVYEQFAER